MSEGIKFDQDKARIALLPSYPLTAVAKVIEFGAKKYGKDNWRGGMDWSRVYSAAQRHLMAWNEGEDTDKETGISHLAHAACNILFLLEYEKFGIGKDDRFKRRNENVLPQGSFSSHSGSGDSSTIQRAINNDSTSPNRAVIIEGHRNRRTTP